jgi:hypothetical protein
MTFPLNLMSEIDLITRARLASATTPTDGAHSISNHEPIRQWQATAKPSNESFSPQPIHKLTLPVGSLASSFLDHKPLQTTIKQKKNTPKAWRKVIEALHPSQRKRRRVQEFDAIIRREIDNPVGVDVEEARWRREMAAIDKEENMFTLQDALDELEPPEKEEERKEFAPIPTFLVEPEKEVVRPLPESELRLFAPGMM